MRRKDKVVQVEPDQRVDPFFRRIIKSSRQDMIENEDDRLYIIVGPTGSGKSMLMLHGMELYEPSVRIDSVAGRRDDFAKCIKKLKDDWENGILGQPVGYDEADSDNLEQNAKWNKALFKIYMKIRYLNGFHFWCWPSLRAVDRRFIEERVNGVFFCYTKEKDIPRKYAYFPKDRLIKLLDTFENFSYQNLKRAIAKFALYVGEYRDYQGKLREDYRKKKYESGNSTVDDFYDQFGGDTKPSKSSSPVIPNPEKFNVTNVCEVATMSHMTYYKRRALCIKHGLIADKKLYTTKEIEIMANFPRIDRPKEIERYKKVVLGLNAREIGVSGSFGLISATKSRNGVGIIPNEH